MKGLPPVINRSHIYFVASPIESVEGVLFAHELLLRYKHFQGAEALLRIVRHLDLQAELDLDVLTLLEESLSIQELEGAWNLNLFSHSLYNSQLVALLEQFPSRLGINLNDLILDLIDLDQQREIIHYAQVMEELKSYGIRFALPASESYRHLLNTLPVDLLKLDINKHPDRDEWKRWKGFSRRNNMKLIAQRVETQEEFDFLQKIQCDYLEGYFIGKPKTLPAFGIQVYDDPKLAPHT